MTLGGARQRDTLRSSERRGDGEGEAPLTSNHVHEVSGSPFAHAEPDPRHLLQEPRDFLEAPLQAQLPQVDSVLLPHQGHQLLQSQAQRELAQNALQEGHLCTIWNTGRHWPVQEVSPGGTRWLEWLSRFVFSKDKHFQPNRF